MVGLIVNFETLKTRHRAIRGGAKYPEALSLRVHRALSWLKPAEIEDDWDIKFILYWIAFNAAYAKAVPEDDESSEKEQMTFFFDRLVAFDKDKKIYNAIWSEFSGPIRLLLDNKYVFAPFWRYQQGEASAKEWELWFATSRKLVQKSLAAHDTVKILSSLFPRIYTLRNQIVHGGATWQSAVMGDQMQLAQPIQGTHPGESARSCLTYLLREDPTIHEDMGIFLPKTFRMHPDLCKIVSEQVYDGELSAHETTGKHAVKTRGPLITKKSGLGFVPVKHESNTQGSPEEVEMISRIARELLGCPYWPDDKDNPREITWNDILFVAPYNYQVRLLQSTLGEQAKVGSVDKFQGQEAPIVILSMCSSDASESPRGIDFLFSKNRLNVAISRAQALAIVVGNPELAVTPVNRIEQMSQVNFFSEISNHTARQ